MYVIDTIREFHTKHFRVVVDAVEDNDLELSWDETGEIRRKLENGTYIYFCARVRVYLDGNEIGADYLGGCIYESPQDFQDHRACGKQNKEWAAQGSEARCGSYFHDMIREACREAREAVRALQSVRVRA